MLCIYLLDLICIGCVLGQWIKQLAKPSVHRVRSLFSSYSSSIGCQSLTFINYDLIIWKSFLSRFSHTWKNIVPCCFFSHHFHQCYLCSTVALRCHVVALVSRETLTAESTCHFGDSDDPWTLVFTCNLHHSDITKQMASCWFHLLQLSPYC